PPPIFVFEGIDFLVDVSNTSGGVLHLNFTRNDNVMRTETVFPGQATKISITHDEYRLGYSETDIIVWATDGDVRISRLWMEIDRRHRDYHPLLMGLQFVLFAFFVIIPVLNWYRTRTPHISRQ
ncbi:MAG: hypothetical protein NWE83_12730, partial [Candidatus Bathyarchaeota archaeon]|nr:hypothetical protein [Candidatus Bathyarchaeota archaeon]